MQHYEWKVHILYILLRNVDNAMEPGKSVLSHSWACIVNVRGFEAVEARTAAAHVLRPCQKQEFPSMLCKEKCLFILQHGSQLQDTSNGQFIVFLHGEMITKTSCS